MQLKIKECLRFAIIALMMIIAMPAFAASKDVTMQVGETQTLYLPSSVTSLDLRSVTFYSNGISYVQVLSYNNYSVTVKAIKAFYNPQNETCNAPRTKGAKIKTKRESHAKRSVPSVRFHIMPRLSHFQKIFARLRRGLRVDPGACPSLLSPAPIHYI